LSPRAAKAVEIVQQHLGNLSERQREAILGAIRSRMTERRGARALLWSAVGAVFAASCGALVALLVHHHGRSEPISFRVEGADLHAGGYLEASSSSRPVVRFSDGSEVTLSEGTRAHIRAVDEHGARVTLDEGQAHAYVVHSATTHWSFDAGPYVVTVTGTALGLSWRAVEHRLDVQLENGAVTVSGPVFDTPVALRGGQWLTVHDRDVLIRDLTSAEPGPRIEPKIDESGAPAEAPSESSAPRRAQRIPPPPPLSTVGHHWSSELADGKFAAIVDEAMAIGLEAAFSGSSSDDLAALSDAARYTRRHDVARGAFLAQRRRFPKSERARVAAFSLGRLAETEQDVRVALSWFETYLVEAPEGTYASEALGRKMLLVQQLDGNDAARPLAEAYVHRFPNGTYARTAHALALGP
jgi:hypothetical protein